MPNTRSSFSHSGSDSEKRAEQDLRSKFEATAKAIREKFFARKKKDGTDRGKKLTPLQKRMHSGGV
jgi:hypothetical protein